MTDPIDPAPQPVPGSGSMWQYKPLPDHPDRHDESDARALDNPPPGFKLIGARVRGKKHKHDGTNCDDWFEFAQVGPWTVIAVSDGAGSKKFSRVGARAACTTAVRELSADLAPHRFEPREFLAQWQEAGKRVEPDLLSFAGRDVDQIRASLNRAMQKAHHAIEAAARDRVGRPEHEAVLQRRLEVADLSCTLLLAAHRLIEIEGKEYSFTMACQVGDGISGAIHRDGRVIPLGTADSGGYSGETEFLTSAGKVEEAFLARKTELFVGSMQALMVMTDGVADDYFPAESHLGRLWADLVVNGIPDLTGPDEKEIANALGGTPLRDTAGVAAADFGTHAEVVDDVTPRNVVWLRSAAELAERLGVTADDLLKHSPVLWAGAKARDPLPGATAQDRLRLWLDAYHVRGSFDDRTLVVLHRETLP